MDSKEKRALGVPLCLKQDAGKRRLPQQVRVRSGSACLAGAWNVSCELLKGHRHPAPCDSGPSPRVGLWIELTLQQVQRLAINVPICFLILKSKDSSLWHSSLSGHQANSTTYNPRSRALATQCILCSLLPIEVSASLSDVCIHFL